MHLTQHIFDFDQSFIDGRLLNIQMLLTFIITNHVHHSLDNFPVESSATLTRTRPQTTILRSEFFPVFRTFVNKNRRHVRAVIEINGTSDGRYEELIALIWDNNDLVLGQEMGKDANFVANVTRDVALFEQAGEETDVVCHE